MVSACVKMEWQTCPDTGGHKAQRAKFLNDQCHSRVLLLNFAHEFQFLTMMIIQLMVDLDLL